MRTVILKKSLLILALGTFLGSCKQETTEPVKEETQQTDSIKKPETAASNSSMQFKQTNYPNGKVKMEGNIENGVREGKWVSFYENGMIWSETYFSKGVKDGPTTTWFPNGSRRYTGEFKNDKEFGKWVYYDENGKIAEEKEYK